MKFSEVLVKLKTQEKCMAFRSGWNGKGMFLFLVPDWTFTNGWMDNSPCSPFICMKTADDKFVPWLASQTDILAEDWNYTSPEGPRP